MEAERKAENDYLNSENDDFDKFIRMFRAEKIYGFEDLAPVGQTLGPAMKKYLLSVPDYSTHLSSLNIIPNQKLGHALRWMNFVEVKGASQSFKNEKCDKSFWDRIIPWR